MGAAKMAGFASATVWSDQKQCQTYARSVRVWWALCIRAMARCRQLLMLGVVLNAKAQWQLVPVMYVD